MYNVYSTDALVEGEDHLAEVKLDLRPAYVHFAAAVGDVATRSRPPWQV